MNEPPFIRHAWLIFIAVTVANAMILKFRSRAHIQQKPGLAAGCQQSFKGILLALFVGGMTTLFAAELTMTPRVAVGAIRWDAWYGPTDDVGLAVQKSLSPKHWHWRLPFFARVLGDDTVEIRGDTDEAMSREIACAKMANLDYWAFCAYAPESPLSRGLKRYLANPARDQVHFCMIADVNHWPPEKKEDEAERFSELMALPNYQRVMEGRPLIFVLNLDLESNEKAWRNAGGFRKALQALRAAARARGLGDPYCVTMIPWPEKAKGFADASGCDAISAYSVQAGGKAAPYSELATYVEDYWKRCAETGAQVVPLAMAGWDRRPRVEHPVFWEQNLGWNAEIDRFYQAPTPGELAGHVRKAVEWTRGHRDQAKAQAVIVYAWNEHDEGGWLCPNLGEGDARVRALGRILP